MPNLNRRDFLKALGVGSASTLAACGTDANQYKTPVELILPYVVKPDQVTPGTPTFFATTVTRGPHARPVVARHRDGRVIFVGQNRFAPGRPGVGSHDLFELQKHYSPDRLKQPSQGGEALSWEEATPRFAEAVRAARAAGKKVAYLGAYKSGPIVELLNDFTGGEAIFWEPTGYEAEVDAAEALFGRRVVPFYALDQAHYVVSFGAPFLGGWGDANLPSRWAAGRNPNVGHFVARFALVAPYRDQTGASCDDWFACAPGSETQVARALAALCAERTNAPAALRGLIGTPSLEDAAKASGIPVDDLRSIAENLVANQGVVLPGGASGTSELAAATYLLNLAIGAAPSRFHLGGYDGPVDGVERVRALMADLNAGRVGVLLVDDANPVYALPDGAAFGEAMAKADLAVALSSHPDETQVRCGLALPTSDVFEDWGIENPVQGLRTVRQPSMSPLYDTRSLGDLLLVVARAAGLGLPVAAASVALGGGLGGEGSDASASSALGFTPESWHGYVRSWWQDRIWDGNGTVDAAWDELVVKGVAYQAPSAEAVTPTLSGGGFAFTSAPAPVQGDVILVSYPHPHRADGRYANQPWAQEISDPLTGITWGSWLEVSADVAERLGLVYDDVVTMTTADGQTVELPVYPARTAHGNVVTLAFGQGHTDAAGRYANDRGVNAFKLFPASQGHTWQPVGATLAKTGAKGQSPATFSIFGDTDEGRNFGVHVSAEKVAAVGDAPVEHPGELTGIHHLELDDRLRSAKIDGFYDTPDHPTYRFGMTVDTNSCIGCWSCSVACYAENNLPIVGPQKVREGREMQWIRVNRYFQPVEGAVDAVQFVPMLCQHCGHAGCESVCPVLATYHNIDGLNAMVYNRCVGTRYCSNACPYSVRRFNYHTYAWPEPFNLQLNPDVVAREMGVMEKCTFCVQRLRATKSAWKDHEGFDTLVPDEAWRDVPACVEACPTNALVFGNLKDPEGHISQMRLSSRTYAPLEELRTLSAINYLAKASFHEDPTAGHGGGEHADEAHTEPTEGAHGAAAGHQED